MPSKHISQHEGLILSRIYDDTTEGYRVLVDRLWPRGVSKKDAALDEWLKDAAPTAELRRWYGHEPDRFSEFKRRYQEELDHLLARQAVDHILGMLYRERVVLLTATRDIEHSAARVLLEHLQNVSAQRRRQEVDEMVDGWSRDSFPASDPPGRLPPTLTAE